MCVYPPSCASLPPFILALPVITELRAEFLLLHSSFPLTVCFTHGNVYMPVLLSQFTPSPSPTVSVCFLHLYPEALLTERFLLPSSHRGPSPSGSPSCRSADWHLLVGGLFSLTRPFLPQVGKNVDKWLWMLGARRVMTRGEGDGNVVKSKHGSIEADFTAWKAKFISRLLALRKGEGKRCRGSCKKGKCESSRRGSAAAEPGPHAREELHHRDAEVWSPRVHVSLLSSCVWRC